MPAPIDQGTEAGTVQTRVWVNEHEWLHGVFRSPQNTAPRFRLSDLLSACISIALQDAKRPRSLISYLDEELTQRNPRTERRTCHVFSQQFKVLVDAHRAAWNSAPNPMFDLDHLATGCVAVAMRQPDAVAAVLAQARVNFIARSGGEGRRVLLS